MALSVRPIDVLAAGELLIDLISTDFADSLTAAKDYTRLQGGSPANLCLNLARLGHSTHLAAAVGQDAMGDFLAANVAATGVPTAGMRRVAAPTTLILVTRSRTTSAFFPYRGADQQLHADQFPDALLARCRIFHTTCFALSAEPARGALLDAAARAVAAGGQLSIDVNYAQKIWPDRAVARRVVADYVGQGALVKCSEVDWERLYGHPVAAPQRVIEHFLGLGAKEVVLTLGAAGSYAGNGAAVQHCPVRPVAVKDTTGAGDAFWSGYLSAWLDGRALTACLRAGTAMAAIKLRHFGPLAQPVDRAELYR